MERIRDLHLWNMNFEVDLKTVVDNIYGKQTGVSNLSAIITHCVHLFALILQILMLSSLGDKQTKLLIA